MELEDITPFAEPQRVFQELCPPPHHAGRIKGGSRDGFTLLLNTVRMDLRIWNKFIHCNILPSKRDHEIHKHRLELLYRIATRQRSPIAHFMAEEIADVAANIDKNKCMHWPRFLTEYIRSFGVVEREGEDLIKDNVPLKFLSPSYYKNREEAIQNRSLTVKNKNRAKSGLPPLRRPRPQAAVEHPEGEEEELQQGHSDSSSEEAAPEGDSEAGPSCSTSRPHREKKGLYSRLKRVMKRAVKRATKEILGKVEETHQMMGQRIDALAGEVRQNFEEIRRSVEEQNRKSDAHAQAWRQDMELLQQRQAEVWAYEDYVRRMPRSNSYRPPPPAFIPPSSTYSWFRPYETEPTPSAPSASAAPTTSTGHGSTGWFSAASDSFAHITTSNFFATEGPSLYESFAGSQPPTSTTEGGHDLTLG